jgi:uncharacterized Ntn-hydrolase superfamily protein
MINHPIELFSTYSIVARDKETGHLGVAVQTHQMCVGAHVPWLEAGVGAVATQSLVNLSFGPMGLAMLGEGVPAPKVVDALVASDKEARVRQVAVVDNKGRVGAWTGLDCIPEASHNIGEGYSVQANMMTHPTVVQAMTAAYECASGVLAERMMAALNAAQIEGGDIRGMQSSALVVVGKGFFGTGDPFEERSVYDLRVDEHEHPLQELDRLVRLRRAQLIDSEGYQQLDDGHHEAALATWQIARELAPELEEMAYWQALTLADKYNDVQAAADILSPMLLKNSHKDQWVDLIRRVQICGILEREGAGDELFAALDI